MKSYTESEVAALLRVAYEAAAEAAARFVDERLYKPGFPACSYHAREIADAIRAVPDQQSGDMEIPPLEWADVEGGLVAPSRCGFYRVTESAGLWTWEYVRSSQLNARSHASGVGRQNTAQAACDAAGLHHEARVRAGLDIAPAQRSILTEER